MSSKPDNPQQGPKLTLSGDVGLGKYSNIVTIAHNFSEVVLDFGRTLPGRDDIPVVSRIIMTPFQARQLLRALSHNLERYETAFGTIPEAPATQQDEGPRH